MPSLSGGCSEFGGVSFALPSPAIVRFGVCSAICKLVACLHDPSHSGPNFFAEAEEVTNFVVDTQMGIGLA